ncbi:MAG: hypothetical protein RL708_344 [Bacteroidota bacterium]|jgi:cell division protein FtsB
MQNNNSTEVKELPENQSNEATTGSQKIRLSDYAFIQAGYNRGAAKSFVTHLEWIKEGHIADEGFSEQEHTLRKKKIENNIQTKDSERFKVEGEKQTIIEIKIPSIQNIINDIKDEIKQIKIDAIDKKIVSDYQGIRYWTYLILLGMLSIYLIFFYASTINSAFFRNANSLIANAGTDITMLLDSIFDPKGIFKLSASLIFVYFGAFLFFAIGLLPHGMMMGKSKYKYWFAALMVLGAFIADSALAYKIDKGLHDLKLMAGVPDNDWRFYSSINFYLVLLFGFCAYLVWGQLYEMLLKEKDKKNTDLKAELLIKELKATLKEQNVLLQEQQTKIKQLESEIEILKNELDKLKKELESAMSNPDELARNLTSFYKGWQQYLMGSSELEPERKECEIAFNEFMNKVFIKNTQIENKN